MNATIGQAARRTFAVLSTLAVLSACGGPLAQSQQPSQMQQPSQPPASNGGGAGGGSQAPVSQYGAVAVQNNYEYSIWYLYVAASSSSEWGPDQLKSNVLSPGGRFTITSIPPGRYDLKAVARDGAVAYVWDFRVTAGGTVNINID